MPPSRRGSGSVTLPTGQTLAFHTRTHDEEDLPHATKKCATCLHLMSMHTHSGNMFCATIEPWLIISENMRVCEWQTHVASQISYLIKMHAGSP
jgi:hypothetical protein